MDIQQILVLARRDHVEAMRVAAGLTIFGHTVNLVFMSHSLSPGDAEGESAELLELADITPTTTVSDMGDYFSVLNQRALASALIEADVVVNL